MTDFDIWVDFMDMRDDRRLWAFTDDARAGLVPITGSHVIVGCEDADPAVAKILSVDADGTIELLVLAGNVDTHRHLLSTIA